MYLAKDKILKSIYLWLLKKLETIRQLQYMLIQKKLLQALDIIYLSLKHN